jgi:NAD(P)-dependent dehydrogenase (short-subunit alcohol dehydrogenase family)
VKVIVIGASGMIGQAVSQALAGRHEVIGASRKGRPSVDLEKVASIEALFNEVRGVGAVVCAAGEAVFKPLAQLTDDDFALSLRSKLMGQVNLVRVALGRIEDGGAIILTSGVLAHKPMPGSAAISPVNAALEGFVRAAALEAPRGVRVNVVSPPWVSETLTKFKMPPDPAALPSAEVARAYVAAVEGTMRGEVIDPARVKG